MANGPLAIGAAGLLWLTTFLGPTGAAPARALVVIGSENGSRPSNDPGWSNVGAPSLASRIFLGNGWMLTASHVGAGPAFRRSCVRKGEEEVVARGRALCGRWIRAAAARDPAVWKLHLHR